MEINPEVKNDCKAFSWAVVLLFPSGRKAGRVVQKKAGREKTVLVLFRQTVAHLHGYGDERLGCGRRGRLDGVRWKWGSHLHGNSM